MFGGGLLLLSLTTILLKSLINLYRQGGHIGTEISLSKRRNEDILADAGPSENDTVILGGVRAFSSVALGKTGANPLELRLRVLAFVRQG
jgi:hypothetical protein